MKIDLTDCVFKTQKEIIRLETFEKRLTIISYIILPFTALSILKTVGFTFNQDAIPFFVFMGVAAIIGYVVKVKRRLPNEYRMIKSYLDEIDETEE